MKLTEARLPWPPRCGRDRGHRAGRGRAPNPVLYLTGLEYYTAGGKNWVRHRYDVFNKDQYPAAMFAAAPACRRADRTPIRRAPGSISSIRAASGSTASARSDPDQLGNIWFATEEGTVPPSYVYIEINDRQTNKKYKSNLADTTL